MLLSIQCWILKIDKVKQDALLVILSFLNQLAGDEDSICSASSRSVAELVFGQRVFYMGRDAILNDPKENLCLL